MIRFLFLVMLLAGCASDDKGPAIDETAGNVAPATELGKLFEVKKAALVAASDPATSWPSVEDCDALLWAGMAKAAGVSLQLTVAEDLPGHWQRRPTPCWTPSDGDVGSRSTISQDMLTGLLWGAWRAQNLELIRRLASYGETHAQKVLGVLIGWVMGEPYPEAAGQVFARQNIYGLVGRMIYALSGGTDSRSYRNETTLYMAVEDDYEKHIQTLGILLQGEVRSGGGALTLTSIEPHEFDRIKENASYDPEDGFFQTALAIYTGDYQEAERLLLSPDYECPSYVRGSDNYCLVHWLFAAHLVLKYNCGSDQECKH